MAARGLDIPLLDNVINYDFPDRAKLAVHRAGRVARQGRAGAALSLVTGGDLPYMLDFLLFLGRPAQTVYFADGKGVGVGAIERALARDAAGGDGDFGGGDGGSDDGSAGGGGGGGDDADEPGADRRSVGRCERGAG